MTTTAAMTATRPTGLELAAITDTAELAADRDR